MRHNNRTYKLIRVVNLELPIVKRSDKTRKIQYVPDYETQT